MLASTTGIDRTRAAVRAPTRPRYLSQLRNEYNLADLHLRDVAIATSCIPAAWTCTAAVGNRGIAAIALEEVSVHVCQSASRSRTHALPDVGVLLLRGLFAFGRVRYVQISF